MSVVIRKLKQEELPTAVDLAVLAFGDEEDRSSAISEFQWMFSDALYTPVILVAEENGQLIGLISYIEEAITYGVYMLSWVCVHPAQQGRSVGRDLVNTALTCIKKDELAGQPGSVLLHSGIPAFYEKFGFTKMGPSHRNGFFMVKVFS